MCGTAKKCSGEWNKGVRKLRFSKFLMTHWKRFKLNICVHASLSARSDQPSFDSIPPSLRTGELPGGSYYQRTTNSNKGDTKSNKRRWRRSKNMGNLVGPSASGRLIMLVVTVEQQGKPWVWVSLFPLSLQGVFSINSRTTCVPIFYYYYMYIHTQKNGKLREMRKRGPGKPEFELTETRTWDPPIGASLLGSPFP